jgi:hypothetical protein
MKKIFVLFLIVITHQVKADVEFVPLDMELGYWEITTQINIDDMLASVPQEQRAMVRGMMNSKMKIPVIKQCITQDSLKDMEAQIRDSFEFADNDCDLQVIKSTAQEFSGELICADGSNKTTISTKSISSTLLESQVSTDLGGMGQNNIKAIGEWKSSICPDGVE